MLYPEDIIDYYSKFGCEYAMDLNKIRDAWSKAKINGHNLDHLQVKISNGKGLGVFSRKKMIKGDIVEMCHCIVPEIGTDNCGDRGLLQYAYHFIEANKTKKMALPLGFGSIYNSASSEEEANLIHISFPPEKLLCFVASKDVQVGDELLTFHGDGYFNTWCKLNQDATSKQQNLQRDWFIN